MQIDLHMPIVNVNNCTFAHFNSGQLFLRNKAFLKECSEYCSSQSSEISSFSPFVSRKAARLPFASVLFNWSNRNETKSFSKQSRGSWTDHKRL